MASDVVEIAFVVPESGPSGIFGPSCQASARLAVTEVNQAGGILGCEVRLRTVDGGRLPRQVADEVEELVEHRSIDAVTGWHTSAVREAIAPRLRGRVPYTYTAVYEGGERTPGVFLTGETPANQLLPAIRWMAEEMCIRNWVIVGNSYVWPRASAAAVRAHACQIGIDIRDEVFVGLGIREFGPMLRRIQRSRPQGVLMLLLGSDAVRFNRAFATTKMNDHCVRLSPLMDENMLMASGAENTNELYSAAGFFETLCSEHSLDFGRRYANLMGSCAPVITSPGESCFEGIVLLAQLVATARTIDVARINTAADRVAYEGPRGPVRIRNRHLVQPTYLARADRLEFDVLAEIHSGVQRLM